MLNQKNSQSMKTLKIMLLLMLPFSLLYGQKAEYDFRQTPLLIMNLKFLDGKFGAQYHGLGLGIEPELYIKDRLRVKICYDHPVLDGKYSTLEENRNSTNELKKFYKLGAGAEFAFLNWTRWSTEEVTVRKESLGGGWERKHYVNVDVQSRRQIAVRGGAERFRYILELSKHNAQLDDYTAVLMIDNQRISEYDAVANWHLNALYLGLSYSSLYSSLVDVPQGKGRFRENFTWYADFIIPASANIETLVLGSKEIDLNPYVGKRDWGMRFGAVRTNEGFVKIEVGVLPGVKGGFWADMSLGYPLRLIKRKR
jgi:hypothetical protein